MSTYLDCIPKDIHDRIAFHLYSSILEKEQCFHSFCFDSLKDDKELDSLLNYAKEGRAQERAVIRAMSNRLHITEKWRKDRVVAWVSVFANRLEELNFFHAPHFSFPATPPRFPKLRKAVIVGEPEQLSIVHGSPKLSELIVGGSSKQWDCLVSTLGSLPLKTLHLNFSNRYMMQGLSRIELMSLRHAIPNVENLYLDSFTTPAIWDMIKGMPSLRKLKVRGNIDDEHIPFVQTLSELELWHPLQIEHLPFASVITSLTIYIYVRERIPYLASLSNLRELRVKLKPGHEIDLIGILGNVESLSLAWDYDKHYDFVDSVSGGPYFYREYYEPECSDIEDIVRSATQLKSLQIINAVLSAKSIRKLLKICGNRLETLEIPHDWQRENIPTRMESILKDVPLYCPNLKTLKFLERHKPTVPIFAEKEQSTKCFHALKGVLEAVPGFKSYRDIRNIIEHRFTHQRPTGILTWDLLPQNDIREW